MNIQNISINRIKPYENNPRVISDDAVEKVMASIKEFGFQQPIVVDKDMVIIVGHTRLKASKKLGLKEVPVVIADNLTEEQARAYRLADNKTNEFSKWADDLLTFELQELECLNFDMEQFGFEAIFEEEPDIEEDDYEIEPVEVNVKLGDIYQLGEHRLMCGDSTDKATVERPMDGNKAQMTFSDAPYNVDFHGSMSNTTKNGVMVKHKGANQRHKDIRNDRMSKENFYDFMCKVLKNIKDNVLGAWYLSFSSVNLEELLNPLRDSDMNWKSIIIWMKNQATLSMKDYKSRYEPIVYGRFDDVFYGAKAKEEDVWEYQRTLKNDLHPTMKPIPLICNMFNMSSKENDIILDLFGGSGSTLIACEQLNRKCFMMELDPYYCQVIIDRWEAFTGNKAVKVS